MQVLTIFSAGWTFAVFDHCWPCCIHATIDGFSIRSQPNTSNRSMYKTLAATRCIALNQFHETKQHSNYDVIIGK